MNLLERNAKSKKRAMLIKKMQLTVEKRAIPIGKMKFKIEKRALLIGDAVEYWFLLFCQSVKYVLDYAWCIYLQK